VKIKITQEMIDAFGAAWHTPTGNLAPGARRRAGIRAVFDILERDYIITPACEQKAEDRWPPALGSFNDLSNPANRATDEAVLLLVRKLGDTATREGVDRVRDCIDTLRAKLAKMDAAQAVYTADCREGLRIAIRALGGEA
jgi:hypothetical protein